MVVEVLILSDAVLFLFVTSWGGWIFKFLFLMIGFLVLFFCFLSSNLMRLRFCFTVVIMNCLLPKGKLFTFLFMDLLSWSVWTNKSFSSIFFPLSGGHALFSFSGLA